MEHRSDTASRDQEGKPALTPLVPPRIPRVAFIAFMGIIVVSAFNSVRFVPNPQKATTTRTYNPHFAPPSADLRLVGPTFSEPELPVPKHGTTVVAPGYETKAPFSIKTKTGNNYLVKLGDSKKTISHIFDETDSETELTGIDRLSNDWWKKNILSKIKDTNSHNTFVRILNNRARISYLYQMTYSKSTHIGGYTITLYTVRDGNLKTSAIAKEEF